VAEVEEFRLEVIFSPLGRHLDAQNISIRVGGHRGSGLLKVLSDELCGVGIDIEDLLDLFDGQVLPIEGAGRGRDVHQRVMELLNVGLVVLKDDIKIN